MYNPAHFLFAFLLPSLFLFVCFVFVVVLVFYLLVWCVCCSVITTKSSGDLVNFHPLLCINITGTTECHQTRHRNAKRIALVGDWMVNPWYSSPTQQLPLKCVWTQDRAARWKVSRKVSFVQSSNWVGRYWGYRGERFCIIYWMFLRCQMYSFNWQLHCMVWKILTTSDPLPWDLQPP